MPDVAASPDWYPDSTNGGRLRFWDGAAWTDRFADQEQVAAPASAVGPPSNAPRGSRRFVVALLAAIVGWIVALVFGGITVAQWNVERARDAANESEIRNMCARLAEDPTLLDDWRSAIELDESVTAELVNLTASESAVRPLSAVLRPLAPRLVALAGTEAFEEETRWFSQRDILAAAIYASRAAAAIDGWDYTDTRYRLLELQMSGDFTAGGLWIEIGYTSDVDGIAETCA